MTIVSLILGATLCGSTVGDANCVSEGAKTAAAQLDLVRLADNGNPPQIQTPEQEEEQLEQQQQQQQQGNGGGGG